LRDFYLPEFTEKRMERVGSAQEKVADRTGRLIYLPGSAEVGRRGIVGFSGSREAD
jgi:hypothetical protein